MSFFARRALYWLAYAPDFTAFALLAVFGAHAARNIRFFRWVRARAAEPMVAPPSVSVLIPARDEVTTIASCVTSLLDQRYPQFEVIVLDDASTDGTTERLASLSAANPRLTVIHATDDPPPGWNGKSFACQRLAARAAGEWLLFTDADTLHEPESLAVGIARALTLDVDLLSVFPAQRCATWGERVMVSFVIDFLPLIGLDLRAMWCGASGRTAANGQYLLARAASYRAIGGHASVRGALIDDFALAGRFRACGFRIALVDGTSMLSCRMYRSFRDVWAGFSKNLLGALTASSARRLPIWWAPIFAWGYASVFVMPFVGLLVAKRRAMAVVEIAGLLLVRGLVGWSLHRPAHEVVTTPLAAWAVPLLGLLALYRRWRRAPVVWKGRAYAATPRRDETLHLNQ
jgi:chlorobactene glucosyltransferase